MIVPRVSLPYRMHVWITYPSKVRSYRPVGIVRGPNLIYPSFVAPTKKGSHPRWITTNSTKKLRNMKTIMPRSIDVQKRWFERSCPGSSRDWRNQNPQWWPFRIGCSLTRRSWSHDFWYGRIGSVQNSRLGSENPWIYECLVSDILAR